MQLTRPNEVRSLHYALLYPADAVLISALKFGLLLETRLKAHDVYLYGLIFGAYPCCRAGKMMSPSYTTSLSPPALMPDHIVHVDQIPFPEICLGDIQYHLLACDEFSTYVHSFAMNNKRIIDIIVAFNSLVSYFK